MQRERLFQPEDVIGWTRCGLQGFRLKVEAIADEQNNSKKIKEDGDVGQWKYPPHPNYFGEMLQ